MCSVDCIATAVFTYFRPQVGHRTARLVVIAPMPSRVFCQMIAAPLVVIPRAWYYRGTVDLLPVNLSAQERAEKHYNDPALLDRSAKEDPAAPLQLAAGGQHEQFHSHPEHDCALLHFILGCNLALAH